MIVKIVRYFSYPDIKRQTPNLSLIWNGITFTEDEVEECDFLIILDHPKNDFSIRVNPKNIFHLSCEPPNEVSLYRQYGNTKCHKIFSQINNNDKKIFQSHPALPWHIDKNYDYLKSLKLKDLKKENKVVWITSNQRSSKQHKFRMDFLESIKNLDNVFFYGRGINEIKSKWDVLKSSKYAIAFENFKNPYYWTEKISDCFLSYTLPIYYGCSRIEDYFPKESIIQIDPLDKHKDIFFQEILDSNNFEDRIEYIEEARNLVLDRYQLFPFLESQINSHIIREGYKDTYRKENVSFKGGEAYFDNYPKMNHFANSIRRKINNKLIRNRK